MEIGTEISQKIRSAIKAKLVELGAYVDDELPDYIMVMVANKKTQAQMAADLALFLAHNTEKFTSWLQNLLKKLQNISAEGTEKEKHKEHKEKHHHHKSEKKKKRTHSSEKKSEKVSKEVKTSKPEETKRESTAKKKEDEKVETVQSKEEEEDKPELLVSENTDEFNEEYKEEEKTKKPTKTAAPKVPTGRVVERVPASKPIIERRTGTVKATPRTETSPIRQAAMPRKVTRVEKIATTKESSAESRKRKQPSSTVTTIKKKYTEVVEPEEEYDPYNPAVGSVASVIRVTARRSSVPKSLQANKSLLLKAVSEAEKSVSKPELHVQPQEHAPVRPTQRVVDRIPMPPGGRIKGSRGGLELISKSRREEMLQRMQYTVPNEDPEVEAGPTAPKVRAAEKRVTTVVKTVPVPVQMPVAARTTRSKVLQNMKYTIQNEPEGVEEVEDGSPVASSVQTVQIVKPSPVVRPRLSQTVTHTVTVTRTVPASMPKTVQSGSLAIPKVKVTNTCLAAVNAANKSTSPQKLKVTNTARATATVVKRKVPVAMEYNPTLQSVDNRLVQHAVEEIKEEEEYTVASPPVEDNGGSVKEEKVVQSEVEEEIQAAQEEVPLPPSPKRIIEDQGSVGNSASEDSSDARIYTETPEPAQEEHEQMVYAAVKEPAPEEEDQIMYADPEIQQMFTEDDNEDYSLQEEELPESEQAPARKYIVEEAARKNMKSKNPKFIVTLDGVDPDQYEVDFNNKNVEEEAMSYETEETMQYDEGFGDGTNPAQQYNPPIPVYNMGPPPQMFPPKGVATKYTIDRVTPSYPQPQTTAFKPLKPQPRTPTAKRYDVEDPIPRKYEVVQRLQPPPPSQPRATQKIVRIDAPKDIQLPEEEDAQKIVPSKLTPPKIKPFNICLKDTDDEEEEEEISPKQARPTTEKCRFWPACANGNACQYHHPSVPCSNFPNCKFGEKCLYIHPNCKFDAKCTRTDCPFTHASKRGIGNYATVIHKIVQLPMATTIAPVSVPVQKKKATCRFYPNCKNMACPFTHPKHCRFGISCVKKNICPYYHPPLPGKDKLTWSKAAQQSLS